MRANDQRVRRVAIAIFCAVASVSSNGSACVLDRTFAGSGFASPPLFAEQGSAAAVARDAQGRYLVAGESNIVGGVAAPAIVIPAGNHVHVSRYFANGQLDSAFGGNGTSQRALNAPSGTMIVDDVETDGAGGAFVLLRSVSTLTPGGALVHVNGDGSWDSGFGGPAASQGLVRVGCGAASTWIMPELLRDELGRLVVASTVETEVSLMRLHADGTRDVAFGSNGCASYPLRPRAAIGLVRSPAGYELVGGGNGEVWTFRVDQSGAPDAAYGVGGLVVQAVPPGPVAVAAEPHAGGLLVPFMTPSATQVVRLDAVGKLDLAFGSGGILSMPQAFRGEMDYGSTPLAVAADGRFALIGRPANISSQLGVALFGADGTALGGCSPGTFDYPADRLVGLKRGVVFDGSRLVVVGDSRDMIDARDEPNVFAIDSDVVFSSGFE